MKLRFLILLVLASCTAQQAPVFTPVAVDMPVPVMCRAPVISPPPDLMATVPIGASLTQFTKACVEQSLIDRSAIAQFQAALTACRGP